MVLSAVGRPRIVEGLRLVRVVGRGGEGEVWEARDGFGRRRAFKLIHPDWLAHPADVAQRGAWLRRIDHPALVRVHRSGVLHAPRELAGWGFVEMDFVDGDSLAERAAGPDVLQRLVPLAEGLDLLHAGCWSGGVPLVHRDVKPANLVQTGDGRLVLVDPSTLRGADATQMTRIGTPLFAAPEVDSGRIGPAADVYSFAVTVVALVTGLRGSALAEALDAPQRLDLPLNLPLNLPRGVVRALAPCAGDRPVSCRALLDVAETITLQRPLAWELQESYGDIDASDDWKWLPAADADVVRSADGDPERPERATPRPVLPWLGVAALAAGLPGLAATGLAFGLAWTTSPVLVAAVAAVVHLAAITLAGGNAFLALVLPPVAWVFVLGDRLASGRRRRVWARSLVLPGLIVMAAAAVLPLASLEGGLGNGPGDGLGLAAAAFGGGICACLLAIAAARGNGVLGALLRLLVAPLWLVGALALIGLCLVLVLPAAPLGAAGSLVRLAATTVAGPLEFGRSFRADAACAPGAA